jgi:nitrite reductase/ring-hydroxylating ferredoxin subunit
MNERLCSVTELPAVNQVREFTLESGRKICVANVWGEYYALDNACPHLGAALGQGTVAAGFIVCPWHGWQIDPQSGLPEQDRTCSVRRYSLIIAEAGVYLSPHTD